MPFYFSIPGFWPFGARHGHHHHHPAVPVMPSSIGTTATSNSMSSHRTRTSSTPGHAMAVPNNIQYQEMSVAQPEMREFGTRNVTFAPTHAHTHHDHHSRSRSVPRPPTEAHIQAYAQQQQRKQQQAQAQQAADTRSRLASQPTPAISPSAPPSRSQSQGPRSSRSQSASINAHLMQGSRTHMAQGTRPYLYANHGLDTAISSRSDGDGHQSGKTEDPSSSLPSLTADSTTSRVGRSQTRSRAVEELELRPATAAVNARPSRGASTGGALISETLVPRMARPRYALHRTDSGSRQIRAHSVDAAGPSRPATERVPEPELFVPPVPGAHGRSRAHLIHVVNRILPHSAQGTGTVPGPAPTIPHNHTHHHHHHTHSLPPPLHRQHQHHHHLPPTHIAAITSQPPQAPYIPPAPEPAQHPPARRLRHHVSFANPNKPQLLHMHPLLAASSPDSPAPICYDVTRPPSRTSVRCKFAETTHEAASSTPRSTKNGEAVPAHVLAEPATDPPTLGKLVLKSDRFPWEVIVTAGCAEAPSVNSRPVVTNNDVLHALHRTLHAHVLHSEWDTLDSDRSRQRRVSRAYQRRVEIMQLRAARDRAQASLNAGRRVSGGAEGEGREEQEGVRRVDWLMGRTRFVGVVVERSAGVRGSSDGLKGVGKLVFTKA
ncbi:hypothetical protein F5879DRAFT_103714 [Lentinula edodes]|nr:hypothetical protein F5879DRAFT_103714 [Lentinula edodes]